jgi:hypothetical protein
VWSFMCFCLCDLGAMIVRLLSWNNSSVSGGWREDAFVPTGKVDIEVQHIPLPSFSRDRPNATHAAERAITHRKPNNVLQTSKSFNLLWVVSSFYVTSATVLSAVVCFCVYSCMGA